MATHTTNYKLTKPASGEAADISVINSNMDTIDATMKSISDTANSKQSALTFDTAPTSGSSNPVTSNGIYQALQNAGGAVIYTNKTASSWTADTTYEDFGYRCAIAISGVTASDVAEVIFDTEQAMSGDYAPVCQTYAGGVYIYSADNASISIPAVLVHKG